MTILVLDLQKPATLTWQGFAALWPPIMMISVVISAIITCLPIQTGWEMRGHAAIEEKTAAGITDVTKKTGTTSGKPASGSVKPASDR